MVMRQRAAGAADRQCEGKREGRDIEIGETLRRFNRVRAQSQKDKSSDQSAQHRAE